MNPFQEIQAQSNKVLSYTAWNQQENGLTGVTSQTQQGACAAYCLYWLKSLNQGNTTFPPDFKMKLAAINTQIEFYKTDWRTLFDQKGVSITSKKINWLKSGSLPFNTTNAAKSVKDLIGTINTSLVIQLILDDNSSHLIALIATDNKVSVFDPNYGLIVFTRDYTETFMNTYLTKVNQAFNNKLVKVNTYQTTGEFNLAPIF